MYQLLMTDTITCMFLSIQFYLLNQIGIISRTDSSNDQLFFFIIFRIQLNGYFVKRRCSQRIIEAFPDNRDTNRSY